MQRAPHSPTKSTPRSLKLYRSVAGPRGARAILLLHGITGSRRYWLPRALRLARSHRLIVPDLPGFGRSPKPFTDYTHGFFVESLVGLLEQEDVGGPVQIVGHSLGALIGLELAIRYPDLVGRMTLLNLPRLSDSEEAHRVWFEGSAQYRNLLMANSIGHNIAQVRRTGLRLTARYMRRMPWAVMADCRRFTFRSLTSTLEHCLLHYRLDDALRAVPRLPVTLIHGDSDQVAPLRGILDLPTTHPHPSLAVIRGAGHHPFLTHPPICLDLIEAHLDERPPRADGWNGAVEILLPDRPGRSNGRAAS